MADEIKMKIIKDVSKVESPSIKFKRVEKQNQISGTSKERAEISEEAKILNEFVPKVLASIERSESSEMEAKAKPASNSDIAGAFLEELIKTILAKKLSENI